MNEHEQKEWLSARAEEVLRTVGLKTGQVLLDFGCGRGAYTLPAASIVGPAQVYAVDCDPGVLEELNRKSVDRSVCNLTLIQPTKVNLSVAKHSVDMVLLFDVLHMVDDIPALLAELTRVIKPDGHLCVYPMHLERSALEKDMEQAGFALKSEHYEGSILLFGQTGKE